MKQPNEYLSDDSLELFIKNMSEFNRVFCDRMEAGDDFTIKLEVHGDDGRLLHCRVNSDSFKRPPGVKKTDSRGYR